MSSEPGLHGSDGLTCAWPRCRSGASLSGLSFIRSPEVILPLQQDDSLRAPALRAYLQVCSSVDVSVEIEDGKQMLSEGRVEPSLF
jgi:hypothetical protein